ncbi:hypothetical protein [Herbidospora yilanensis]|uniref:hypothetical protein n=1 Tax=Herbidospora yilanensis TaxID=354426 RepID=UPI0007822F82|nr:hypothetical protein [Herbidospora yilanensis]
MVVGSAPPATNDFTSATFGGAVRAWADDRPGGEESSHRELREASTTRYRAGIATPARAVVGDGVLLMLSPREPVRA